VAGGEGNPYCIIVGGAFAGVAGTSASSPVVAGVFAKLNEVRLAAGKPPLGFLNPLIYKIGAQGFNDVTQGRNCGGAVCRGNEGFQAIAGWDPATGWGTPNFEALKALV
jgi:tripeptidyl-peptidase-1